MNRNQRYILVSFVCTLVLSVTVANADEVATPIPTLYTEPIQLTASTTDLLRQKIADIDAQIARLHLQKSGIESTLKLEKRLRQGDRGEGVKMLQQLLATDPTIYPEGTVNGTFGPRTARAVKKLQERLGIEPLGNVGPKTLAEINQLFADHTVTTNAIPPALLADRSLAEAQMKIALDSGSIVARKTFQDGIIRVDGKLRTTQPCSLVMSSTTLTTTGSTSAATIALTTGVTTETCATISTNRPFHSEFSGSPATEIFATINGSSTPIAFFDFIEPKFRSTGLESVQDSDIKASGKLLPIPPGFGSKPGTPPFLGKKDDRMNALDQQHASGTAILMGQDGLPIANIPPKSPDNRWWGYQSSSTVSTSTEIHTSGNVSGSASAYATSSATNTQ